MNGGVLATDALIQKSRQFFSHSKQASPRISLDKNVQMGIFRGLVLTIPVIFVLFILLSSADPIFSKTVSNFFTFSFPQFPAWIFNRVVFSVIFLFITVPTAWLTISEKFHSPFQRNNFHHLQVEAMILSGSVAFLLVCFLLIQFRYLFTTVNETELHQFGVQTYSEYVRKGFGELLLVSFIVYIVAGLGMVVHRVANDARKQKLLRFINVALLIETLVFIFSVMRRVWLYQESHGLSRSRAYGMIFLVLMFLFTVVLILRHYHQYKIRWYLIEAASVMGVILFIFVLNADKTIATQDQPTVNGEVDYGYIARLSPDGVDGWLEGYQQTRQFMLNPDFVNRKTFSNDEARHIIYARDFLSDLMVSREDLGRIYKDHPFSTTQILTPEMKAYNFAEASAYQKLRKAIPDGELENLRSLADAYQQKIVAQPQPVQLDRSTDSPLVK